MSAEALTATAETADAATRTIEWGVVTPNRGVGDDGPGFKGLEDFERFVAHAEDVGSSLVALGEAPTVFEDTFVWLAAAARVTKRSLLGHSTMVPSIRHPAVLASSFSTIQRLSEGRAFNGIGTGAIGLLDVGLKPAKLEYFERYCLAVRDLTEGKEVEWEGNTIQMRWNAGRVPLFMGAEGPKALRLVGKVADGSIIGTAISPDTIRFTMDHVRAGAAEAGRSVDGLKIWYQTRIQPSSSIEAGLHEPAIEQYLSRYARHVFLYSQRDKTVSVRENLLTQRGIVADEDMAERLRMYNEEYSEEDAVAGRYGGGTGHNLKLLDKYELRYWIGPQCWITGTHEDIVATFRQLIDAGARRFTCVQLSEDRFKTIEQVGAVFDELR